MLSEGHQCECSTTSVREAEGAARGHSGRRGVLECQGALGSTGITRVTRRSSGHHGVLGMLGGAQVTRGRSGCQDALRAAQDHRTQGPAQEELHGGHIF